MSHSQKPRRHGINVLGIEFPEIATIVDEHGTLEGLFGEGVVAYTIVSEIIKDFEREEVAGRRHVGIPGEDGAIDNFNMICMTS